MNTLDIKANDNITDFSTIVLANLVPAPTEKFHTFTPTFGDFEIERNNSDADNFTLVDIRIVSLEEFQSGL